MILFVAHIIKLGKKPVENGHTIVSWIILHVVQYVNSLRPFQENVLVAYVKPTG